MRYVLAEIDLAVPIPPLEIPADASGIGLLVRIEDKPATFLMFPATGRISSQQVLHLVRESAGQEITAGVLRAELASKSLSESMPPVTVAICTRDHPDLVYRAVRSILLAAEAADIVGHVEILIVDNAPPDGKTRAVAAAFEQVRYVCEPKPGLDFARNRAIQEATGTLLAFIDDDAVMDRGWFQGLRRAWADNPQAAAFTGPVCPYELETAAQILFEERGGFGRTFLARRFGPDSKYIRNYPCNAGILGTGCNMAFNRRVLIELGGFDDALDTGAPLPGGGDLDIFYRVIRAGFILVHEPQLMIRHQHRREHRQLRRQMYTWGLGMMAHAVKNYRSDPARRTQFRRMIAGWFRTMTKLVLKSAASKGGWRIDLATAELWGGIVGVCGEYDRSRRRIEAIRKQFA